MILSDRSIREALMNGRITIDPLGHNAIQPSSVDLRLDNKFRIFPRPSILDPIDVRLEQPDLTDRVKIPHGSGFTLTPGRFILGSTVERIVLPDDLVARLEGKSSLGRLGLMVHATAGFVDPGFDGNLTLELSNVSPSSIRIYAGMKIGQIAFFQLSTPAERPYGSKELGSKYQGQRGPTASRYFENYRNDMDGR